MLRRIPRLDRLTDRPRGLNVVKLINDERDLDASRPQKNGSLSILDGRGGVAFCLFLCVDLRLLLLLQVG